MIQNEARKKNHPEVSAGSPATSSGAQNRRRDDNKRRHLPQSGDEVKEALKTKMDRIVVTSQKRARQCPQKRNIVHFTKEPATSLQSAKPLTS